MAGIPNNIVSILAVDNAGATTVIDVASFISAVQPTNPTTSIPSFAQTSTQRVVPNTVTQFVENTTTNLSITADPNYIPKVNSTQDNLINSLIYDKGNGIGINTNSPQYLLDIYKGSVNLSPLLNNDGYKINGLNIAYTDRTVSTKEAIVMGDDSLLPRVNINTLLLRGLIPSSPLGSTRILGIDDYGVAKVAVAGVDYQDVIGYVPANAATTLTINGVSYDLYSNRTWSVGTVTSVAALTITASGTDVTSTVSTPNVTPVITLNIPSASATNRGVLASADWSTFNNKQAALVGTGFVKSSAGVISYDNSTYYLASNPSGYISANQSITLSGDISGTGTTAITTTLATVTQTSTGNFVKVTLDTKGRVTGNTAVLASDITTALTYTPVPTTRNITINGTTYDLSADRSWTINIGSTARNIIKFTATAGQTTFTITGGYSVGLIDVYLNGARLSGTDYTASNGTTVVLASGVVAGDIIETVAYTSYAASSISGAGTTGYITKWTGSSAQGNSIIQDSGTAITVGGNVTATSFIKSGGTSAQFLMADGSVSSGGGGTVSSVAALTLGTTGTDLSSSVANSTTTPVITLNVPTASATNRGALSSTDWSTFNGKQGAITLTTTGSSGAATFTTNTLNIPNYTLAGLGGQASSTNLTSLAGLTYASASFVKMTASGTFSLDTNTYASTSALASYLPLAGGTMTGQLVSSFAEAIKLTQGSGYIAGYNAAGTTRQGYIQWTNGNAYFAAEASSNLVLMTQGSNRVSINTAGDLSVLYGSYFSGTINTYATQAIKMIADSCYIGGFNTAGTTRYGYLQFASGSLNLASEAGAALNLISNSTTRIYVTPAGNTGMGTTSPLSMLHLYGGTLTVNSSGTTEIGGGMRLISHTKRTVNSTKFIKIYAGTNNYFTGFIYYMNFDDYPVGSATSTGSGGSVQFGGYSDGAGSHADKYMDSIHFGGNNVGGIGREMNTDGNGYIITATTSTGAGGFKCSATIMLFARDMSQVVISYY